MEKVTGRSDDMIIIRGVNLFPTQIEELILRTPSLSPHFQCVLTRSARLDELTILVEARGGVGAETAADAGAVLRMLIKNTVGVTVHVEVVPADSVERSMGKMRRVVDNRELP